LSRIERNNLERSPVYQRLRGILINDNPASVTLRKFECGKPSFCKVGFDFLQSVEVLLHQQ